VGAVDGLFGPHYVDHDPGRGDLRPGPEGVKQAWGMLLGAFPDLRATILDTVEDGDVLAVRGEISGTHRGPLMGLATTGNRVSVSLIDFNRVADGRLVERWGQMDTLGLLQQLGAVPSPPAGNDRSQAVTVPSHERSRSTPDGNANKALARRYAEVVLNGHDLDAAEGFLAPDFVGHLAGCPTAARGGRLPADAGRVPRRVP
jgi:predicted SnoaL-like aldol condensation-catalyzing enzyme